MPINKLFGGNIALMGQALNLRSERQGLIQSNIANLETPGYKVQEFSFDKVMETVMAGQGTLSRTHGKHLVLDPVDVSRGHDFKKEDRPVDIDEEMLKLSENQLMYEIASRLIGKKFDGLKYAIEEGGK
ncbi:MAG: flagellar basal body rod protein FlgB [Thermodesulfobacteriota bacterium]|nr:flagellar basal body rod protein FlgB [Thermodesulfobacteriota bacterium]